MYKKKLIAVAISAAFGLPLAAQAQTSVTIYGKMYPQINNGRVTGATAAGTDGGALVGTVAGAPDVKHTVMESPNARLGFRGTEDLGSGMKALFQLETAFGVDNGVNQGGNRLFHRNTFVGLSGGFGSVKLGRMDTVYKEIGDTLSFLGISSGNFMSNSGILSKPGIGDSGSSFHLRNDNTIMYESPEVAGFQGLVGYSLGEVAGDTGLNSVLSAGVTYSTGPLYLALAHERHNNFWGGSRNADTPANFTTVGGVRRGIAGAESEDMATRLTAQYKITKDTRIEANIARLEYDETGGVAGGFRNYRTNTWSIGAEHKLGAVTFATSYARADDGSCSLVGGATCSTAGLAGSQFNIGAGYSLSKRTLLYAVASKLKNDQFARFSNLDQVNGGDLEHGQDIRQIAVGLSHSF